MSFDIKEHVVSGQHIRELPAALAVDDTSSDSTIHLHVKQYIPRNNPNPRPGDLTIIALHGNGFCKEVYEPLWEQLLASLPPNKRLRSIWMADVAHQGSSYLLNENKLGNGFTWDDHARDVLQMINQLRNEMPPPILGVGHSMGTTTIVRLANFHPRLFHSVALLEPWFSTATGASPVKSNRTLKPLVFRKDTFSDPETVSKAVKRNPLFKNWHPKCLEIYTSHLLRPLPTLLHPDRSSEGDRNFTLRTPKQMEVFGIQRPNVDSINTTPIGSSRIDRLVMPDTNYAAQVRAPVVQPAPLNVISWLPTLRPRCLFLYGNESHLNVRVGSEADRKRNLEITGAGSGGSGGMRLGCVSEGWIPGSHLFPFEHPQITGERLAQWVVEEGEVWWKERKEVEEVLWQGKQTAREKQSFDPRFVETIKEWDGNGWDDDEEIPAKAKL